MSKSNEMQFPFTSKSKGVTKMTLTIKEAAEYSNIGINKIDSMLR